MFAQIFGMSNGIITILGLITGLYAAKVNKVGIIAAILSMIIVDPLSDAYSIYIGKKHENAKNAYEIGKNAYLYQFTVQLMFLIIIILSPNLKIGMILCYLFGFTTTIGYGIIDNNDYKSIIINIFSIIVIVSITYGADRLVSNYFN